jgi:paraquat-inducible protein B
MPEEPEGPEPGDVPRAIPVAPSRWKLQIIWLIPLVAALIGGLLAARAILERGPTITISFKSAEGLEAGKTKLKYKDVDVGLVKSIALSRNLSHVLVSAELAKDFASHLVEDTRFWIVRPRFSGGTLSGLNTLFSGPYIGVDAGHSRKAREEFTGLDRPPVIALDVPGREYSVRAEDAGSIEAGVPVFFRQLPVGQVSGYDLDPDGKSIAIRVFVNEPYTRYVNTNTRFWNASGIKLRVDSTGVKLDTQSLISVLIGGIAFDNPATGEANPGGPASPGTKFVLYPDRELAMRNPETEVLKFTMVFEESARGLAIGAPVDFNGIVVGEVDAVDLDIDPKTGRFITPVEVSIYPERVRMRSRQRIAPKSGAEHRATIDALVVQGLRAQLRSANLLTGQLYIALDYFPARPGGRIRWDKTPPEVPTAKGNIQEIQVALASVASKLDRLPLDQIGTGLKTTLTSANALLSRLDAEVAPEAQGVLSAAHKALGSANRLLSPDQALQQDARNTMQEVARAAAAVRVLADYLERHPEAIIRGKKKDEK